MATGAGKYGPECEDLQQTLAAEGVVLIVFGGARGHGFSVAASPEVVAKMPNTLRIMADQIDRDIAAYAEQERRRQASESA